MKQMVLGIIGIAAGLFIAYSRTFPVEVGDLGQIRSGYWKGHWVEVTGLVKRTDSGVFLVDDGGTASLRLKGCLPPETGENATKVSGRLGRDSGGRAEDFPDDLPYVLEVGAARADPVTIASIIVVLWGVGLLWAGIMVRKNRPKGDKATNANGSD